MTQYDESQCYPVGPNMVSYKCELFSVHFPRHLYESVLKCENCKYYGKWNGCIIMQCINCASGEKSDCKPYDMSKYGAIGIGNEFNSAHPNSASSTYLKGIDWATIGDIHLENSAETTHQSVDFEKKLCENVKRVSKVQFTEDNTQEPQQCYSDSESDTDSSESDTDSYLASDDVEGQHDDASPYKFSNDNAYNNYKLFRLEKERYKVIYKITEALNAHELYKLNVLKENLDLKIKKQTDEIAATEYATNMVELNQNNTAMVSVVERPKLSELMPDIDSTIQYDKMTADGFENPLHEVMSWPDVEIVFAEWKIINAANQDSNQTCLEWASSMKGLWYGELTRTGNANLILPIVECAETLQQSISQPDISQPDISQPAISQPAISHVDPSSSVICGFMNYLHERSTEQIDTTLPDGIENPLKDILTWVQVVSEYERWNSNTTQKPELTCLEWAMYMKDLFDELHVNDDDEMPNLILVNDEDLLNDFDLQNQQLADLQNQTGIFDWTPDNSFGEGPEIETGHSTVIDMY